MPTQILNYETPLACFLKAYPHNQSISSLPLRVFGCTIVHIHNNHRNKHDLKTRKCLFLGYSPTQKRVQMLLTRNTQVLHFNACEIH